MSSPPLDRTLGAWLAIGALAVTTAAGCAGRHLTAAVAPAAPPSTRDIAALIERGCFHCLEQALTLADQRHQPRLAFEAAVLLALRATELGMPADVWIARAGAVATEDPERLQYLEMVQAGPPDPMRGIRGDLLAERQMRQRIEQRLTSVDSWYEAVQAGSHSEVFRRYVELTLLCAVDRRSERVTRIEALVPALPDVPLLQYRLGICDDRYQAQLRSVQAEVPEFVDADYARARYAAADPEFPDQDLAMRLYRSAATAFPLSTAIPTVIGNLYQAWEDWNSALTAFDRALELLPSHPDALLGRLISLSHLSRHDDAIATATQLIEGGQWHLGPALYWRAWNHYTTGNNQAARSDADRTRTLMVNPDVFVLSGLIEWRFKRLEPAETEFQEALKMDFGQCEAAFYLGGAQAVLRKWTEALAAMTQARQCYDLALSVRRKLLAEIVAGPGTPEQKVREAEKHERSIADIDKRRAEAVTAVEQLQALQIAGSGTTSGSPPRLP